MNWYGDHANRVLGLSPDRARTSTGASAILRPVVIPVSDPLADLQVIDDMIEQSNIGGKKPTKWMQRLRPGSKLHNRPSGVTVYEGRLCCYEHLSRYEARPDLQYPFDITCPGCGATFQIRLALVRR